MQKLVMPQVKGNFDNSDRFKFEKASHSLRVYAFHHADQDHLAAVDVIHFLPSGGAPKACKGDNCPYCAEAFAIDSKMAAENGGKKPQGQRNRLKAVTRYPLVVVDTEAKEQSFMRWDAPQTVYQAIYNNINDPRNGGPELLGNDGTDFIIAYNAKAQPAQQYSVSLRLKNNLKLKMDTDKIPDLIAEVEYWKLHGNDPLVTKSLGSMSDHRDEGGGGDDDGVPEGQITFTNAAGEEKVGKFTGKMQAGKYVVESEGRIVRVELKKIVVDKSDTSINGLDITDVVPEDCEPPA